MACENCVKAEAEVERLQRDAEHGCGVDCRCVELEAQRDALREALENIADKDFDCQDPSCGLPVPVCKDIAAAALKGASHE